jgi:Holliday junction resolvasome RuvABC endonuclease subunit
MNVLAFDLGSHVGWAALHEGRLVSGAWDNPARYADCPGRFFVCFRTWLADMRRWHEPELVAFEMTHPGRGQHQGLISYGMITRVQEWAYAHDMREVSVFSSTLKKFTTGNGRAEKADMIAAMKRRWKLKRLTNPDEADALAVLSWVIEKERIR